MELNTAGRALAEVMRAYLLELNVRNADVIVEDASRTTFENAVESRRLLEQRQIRKVVLVTDAIHMSRALGCFRKQGLDVIPAPCHFQAGRLECSVREYLPSANAASLWHDAIHEWLGTAWYRLQGRI